MIRRLFVILAALMAALIGLFVGLCVAAFFVLRAIWLFVRRLVTGEPARPIQAKADAGVIETSYTVIREDEPRA